jgi:hypothetical protein
MLLNAIAVILAGVALLMDDGITSSKYTGALFYSPAYTRQASTAVDGISAGTLAGISGIVLGILAILGIATVTLTAVAVIIFGAAILFEFAARTQTMMLRMASRESPEPAARLVLTTAPSMNTAAMLIGVALITLGILAVAGLTTSILVTIALLGLGAYLFLQNVGIAGALFGTRS